MKGELSKSQREYWLRQQLKAIREELNEGGGADGDTDEMGELGAKLDAAGLPTEARAAADRELRRLKRMQPMQAEFAVLHNYLEWLAAMPWGKVSEDSTDLAHAREVLERDHHGLPRVKRRITEHLAVFSLRRAATKGPILCLVGPPGVGKTSLGRSVAAALGRSFQRVSLGGVSDAAEV